MTTAQTPDVVGATEGARIVGVSRQRFSELTREPGFPPATVIGRGRVWDGPTLRAWADNRAGRRRHTSAEHDAKHALVLAEYREHRNVNRARLAAGVKYDTARRWIIRAGLLDAPIR